MGGQVRMDKHRLTPETFLKEPSIMTTSVQTNVPFKGNDKLLFGMIMGVVAF